MARYRSQLTVLQTNVKGLQSCIHLAIYLFAYHDFLLYCMITVSHVKISPPFDCNSFRFSLHPRMKISVGRNTAFSGATKHLRYFPSHKQTDKIHWSTFQHWSPNKLTGDLIRFHSLICFGFWGDRAPTMQPWYQSSRKPSACSQMRKSPHCTVSKKRSIRIAWPVEIGLLNVV